MTVHSSPSPYSSARNGRPIGLLVVHATVGTLAGTLSWFRRNPRGVSASVVIAQNGDLYTVVPDHLAAHHAGTAWWNGWNTYEIRCRSLGVELVNRTGMPGFIGQDPYTQAQLDTLTEYTLDKMREYEIDAANVVRHVDIAPGRKSDPAGFPWAAWKQRITSSYDPTWYRVTAPAGLNTREGPGTQFPEAVNGQFALAHGDVFLSDTLTEGETINGNPWWAHRADGIGFLSQSYLEALS